MFLLFVLVSTLLCYKSSAQCSSSTLVRIDPSQVNPEQACNDDLVCRTLQDAIDYVSATAPPVNSSGVDCDSVVIEIPDGQHYITNPTHFGNKSVHFIGSGDSVTVLCDYLANENTTDSYEMHTWYFEYSESVLLRDIHFRGCGFPIRLSTLRIVQVHNCTFRYFTQAVLDIFNCQNVSVRDILVEHNTGGGTFNETFRGNTGGVAIGYVTLPDDFNNTTVEVLDSVFTNNSAHSTISIEGVITDQVFVGRGGGLGFFIDESVHHLSVIVSGCVFQRNFANLLGGGLFVVVFSYNTVEHYILIEKCHVISNVAMESGGGGIQLSHELIMGDSSVQDNIHVRECNFVNNRSPAGGGLYIIPGNDAFFQVDRCNFTGNEGFQSSTDFGGALGIALVTVFIEAVTLPRQEVKDCFFVGNSGENGIVTIGYNTPVKFLGHNYFMDNNGTSLQIVGSLVELHGYMKFTNNTVNGISGSLEFLSFAQVRFDRGFQMEFEENTGRIGASITIGVPSTLSVFNQVIFNPQCFALYENRTTPPTEWENVTIVFSHNNALIASGVYAASQVDTCAWSSSTSPFFNTSFIPDWPLWRHKNNTNRGYVNSSNQALSFGTGAEKLSAYPNEITAWPGQRITMVITGLDQFGHSTIANARFFRQIFRFRQGEILRFIPEIAVIADNLTTGLLNNNFTLSYEISNTSIASHTNLGLFSIQDPFLGSQLMSTSNFTLRYLQCPGGYHLTQNLRNNYRCTCVDTPEIVACEDDQDSIILKYGFWAGFTPLRRPNLFFYPCPAGYCRCTLQDFSSSRSVCVYKYTHSDQYSQCQENREGVLCGGCAVGHGVTVLLQRCDTCSNGHSALLVLLITVDIAVFLAITIWNIPFSEWLQPFLFYIQMAPYVSQYYPQSFGSAGEYLYYLSSGTSFYFIYDFCLFENLSAQVSYALRYLPACVAAVVFTVVWLIRKYILKYKVLHHNGYWWFVLLSFPLVVHTSLSILNCPSIPIEDGSTSLRWFVNGEVHCFRGGHLLLSLTALLALTVCGLFLVVATFLPLMKNRLTRFKRFVKPLIASYEEQVKWWSGVELGRRLLFLLFFIYFPRNTVYAILVLVVIIAVYGYVQPYKSRVANILELVIQVNFLIFMLLEATTFVRESLFKFPVHASSNSTTPQDLSSLSWLLLPFYYFPLLLLFIVGCVHLILYCRRKFSERKQKESSVDSGNQASGIFNSLRTLRSPQFIAQTVWIDDGLEGTADMREASQSQRQNYIVRLSTDL